jgi:hypothetical protein
VVSWWRDGGAGVGEVGGEGKSVRVGASFLSPCGASWGLHSSSLFLFHGGQAGAALWHPALAPRSGRPGASMADIIRVITYGDRRLILLVYFIFVS